jgi:ATP-dependent Clp protease protease subunit
MQVRKKKPKMPKKQHDHNEPLHAPMLMGYADSYVKMSRNRSIFFSENVSKKSAAELSALLLYYDHINHEEPIYLYIHSDGGEVDGLNNIYDVMQMIEAPIKTILLGKCYSAGAVILAAGDERYALPSSQIMIHGLQFAFPLMGSDTHDNKAYFDFLRDNNDKLMKILAKHTGQSLARVKQDCQRELWMGPEEAVEYGIIDAVIEPPNAFF